VISESCDATCDRVGGKDGVFECDAGWLDVINSCQVMRAAFPEALTSPCVEGIFYGRDLPILSTSGNYRGSILLNSRPEQYPAACSSTSAFGRRLCPCVNTTFAIDSESPESPQATNRRVRKSLMTSLPLLRDKLAAEGADKAPVILGREELHQAYPPDMLLQKLQAKATLFIRAHLGQSCLEACSVHGFGCSPEWFHALNNCDALFAAYPEARACRKDVRGVDLPAYRNFSGEVLVNAGVKEFRSLCSTRDMNTQRVCGCGVPLGGPKTSKTYHTVYSVQASEYFEWQVRFMHLWHNQSGTPGRITRLLSATANDHLVDSIATHVAPPHPIIVDRGYQPYNKPAAIINWLDRSKPTEDIIMVIDPDCMFVNRMDIVVEEGAPIAQRAFYSFRNLDDVPMQIARRYCAKCTFVDAIAVPVIIHQHDLRKIGPLWLKKTAQIRADRNSWPPSWNNKSLSKVGLGWTAEMFGYVFAAAELGIRHEVMDLQNVPTVHKLITTSIIHYHVEVPLKNGTRWYKHDSDAGTKIPWPVPKETDEVSTTILRKLHEAFTLLGPTNHTFKGPNRYTPDV